MKKRFTDSDKWIPQFRSLSSKAKLLWFYINDKCDSVGVWVVDWDLAKLDLGELLEEDLSRELKVYIYSFDDKWWIKDFVDMQYGELHEYDSGHHPNNPRPGYVRKLKEYGLWQMYLSNRKSKTLTTTEVPPKSNKEEEKEKYKEKEKEEEKLDNTDVTQFKENDDFSRKNLSEIETIRIKEALR